MFAFCQVFHDIAYKAKDRQDLLAGIEEFLDEVIVLPPGEWDPDIRIEPPKSLPSSDKRCILIQHFLIQMNDSFAREGVKMTPENGLILFFELTDQLKLTKLLFTSILAESRDQFEVSILCSSLTHLET